MYGLAYQVSRVVEEETRDLISCNDLDGVFGRVGHRIRSVLFRMNRHTMDGILWEA